MYHEREKRGFDLTSEVCELLHLLSLDQLQCACPGGQRQGKIVTAAWGGALCTKTSVLQRTMGLLVNVSAWVRIMTRLINHEFIPILKQSLDGTKL